MRNKQVDSNEDNMLVITNDGRKLALDQRLINPMLPDSDTGKVAVCAENVYNIWERTAEKKSTQMVFVDLSTPHNDGQFNVYDDLKKKLLDKGIPESEIAYIHDAKTEAAKKELFGKTSVFISFDDTYELSAAYTLESITNDYWGSILHEVKNMGRVEYSLLANGEWGFEGNIMTILLEDSFLARDKSRVLKEYMEHLELIGEGGTDFRPAFEYVNHLIEQGEFYHLKGLIYFTDGKGTYPKKKPPYQTAFIFMQEEYEDVDVPPWAVKLIVDAEDLDEGEEEHEY